ncbi:acyl-CoA dehydrogenase [Bacillus sp. REN10]|uniref:acyl-CoA dehydrogenase family protein n=1 Tax=Bacillus sp. REN10 TaxID=2782541 RepID=UPI00193B2657|nr:acyl-CoA dehydrogenase [Bacillus sp. REN10]
MEFSYNDEEVMLQRSIRDMLKEKNTIEHVRHFIKTSEMSQEIRKLIAQQGILSMFDLASDENKGMIPGVIFAQEAGRALLAYPYIEATLVNALLSTSDIQAKMVANIETGRTLPTIAWTSTEARVEKRGENHYVANGILKEVPFAKDADLILASIRVLGGGFSSQEEETLVLIDAKSNHLNFLNNQSMDETYPLYEVALHDYAFDQSSIVLAEGMGVGNQKMKELKRIASLLLAAELTGASERMMHSTLQYLKERKQFGVAIGSFQALKHMAADMFTQIESMKAAIDYSAWALDMNHKEAEEAVSIAKSYASSHSIKIAGDAIQMHGGIGYTWENDMHLFFKRIRRAAAILGNSYDHRETIAKLVID